MESIEELNNLKITGIRVYRANNSPARTIKITKSQIMLEKLLPYIRLGIEFLKNAVDLLAQLLDILISTEGSISGVQSTAL